jgi:lysophospholipase L1-like esterase
MTLWTSKAPPWARGRAARAVLAISAAFLVLAVLVAAGVVERFVHVRVPRARVIASLALYDAIACASAVLALTLRRAAAAALLCAVLGAFAVAEGALRLIHPAGAALAFRYVFSPRFHHTLPPRVRMVARMVAANRLDVAVETNEDGFRTAYSREAFLARKRRVAVLGDSFVFGLGVAGDASVPAVLERLLRERAGSDDIAVLNTGAVGYSPFLEKLVFRRLVASLRPELVFLVLDATDFADDYNYAHVARYEGGEPSFAAGDVALPEGLSPWSRLAIYERAYFAGYRASDLILHPLSGGVTTRGHAILPPGAASAFFVFQRPPEETRPYFEATLRNVVEVAGDARRAGARFVLVVPPRYQLWDPSVCPHNWEARSYGPDDPYTGEYLRFFDEARARVDFDVVSLLPAFRASPDPRLVFDDDPHWNEKGNLLVARALADYVEAHDLLGPSAAGAR